jgi:beta-1,4-mannosyl-glycoprotein beta-1,4-N-acetylglucosaminyltransferase
MKIYDCFTFFNELELLELRLMTLNDIVDYFVIVEADRKHSGPPKEFILEKNKDLFQKYIHKIRYVKVSLPDHNPTNAWPNENFQRNAIMRGIQDADPEDYIMISDLDEIPNPDGVMDAIENKKWEQFILEQKLTYYYVNNLNGLNWHGTVVIKKKLLKTPQYCRDIERRNPPRVVLNGGWHYSFIGDVDKIKTKLESYAETQTNNPEINNDEHILNCLETGKDLFKRDDDWRCAKKFVSLDEMGHEAVKEWMKKYPQYVKEI